MEVLWKNLGFKYFSNTHSFFHLFLTTVSSSRKLNRVIWSFGSHSGQFLNYKPTWDVPSRPDSTWAAVQTRGRTLLQNFEISYGVLYFLEPFFWKLKSQMKTRYHICAPFGLCSKTILFDKVNNFLNNFQKFRSNWWLATDAFSTFLLLLLFITGSSFSDSSASTLSGVRE